MPELHQHRPEYGGFVVLAGFLVVSLSVLLGVVAPWFRPHVVPDLCFYGGGAGALLLAVGFCIGKMRGEL